MARKVTRGGSVCGVCTDTPQRQRVATRICLRACYAMSGTAIAYGAMLLREQNAMCSIDIAYADMLPSYDAMLQLRGPFSVHNYVVALGYHPLSSYARAVRLAEKSGTELAYAATMLRCDERLKHWIVAVPTASHTQVRGDIKCFPPASQCNLY
eukprot:2310856-Rhodomonas_salina.2